MDEISSQLRAAVEDAPPTRIDVDRLIADDRQRRRHRAWTMAGTGMAVLALTVTSALVAGPVPDGLTLPGGSPSAGPSLCPTPTPKSPRPEPPMATYDTVRARPTEPPDEGVARLTVVLRAALDEHLPAGLAVQNRNPTCDRVQFRYSRSTKSYSTSPVLRRGDQVEDLSVTLTATATGPLGCAAAMDGSVCASRRLPDGSLLATTTMANPMHEGVDQRWAEVWRTDGTHVSVTTSNFLTMTEAGRRELVPAPPRLVSMEQLTAIATTPGLTLYP
ncbi:hypothetical protein [Micromonospora globbae]|uniref:Uncharacterized protein n=1 Tax=Micromonospora globbae TaxID=1894969 RepID=A0A420F3A7_9ACTN|nr:hypothetical protein [Micromonospora globbae]RKF27405.1 hypothetical protein D7I43_10105 [Micromonospora globbae]